MLKRLVVTNFRSLVNTIWEPGSLTLLVGGNGSGKTSLFDVLDLLRQLLVEGSRVADLFPAGSRTRWNSDGMQQFHMELEIEGTPFTYDLSVIDDANLGKARIDYEVLAVDDRLLFRAQRGRAHLYLDDRSEGQPLLMDWSRSGVAALEPSATTAKLTRFRQACRGILLARISPTAMVSRADGDATHPLPDFSNFAAWYRHVSQELPERIKDLFDDLKRVLPGFVRLRLERFPDNVRDLRVQFDCAGKRSEFRLSELSDGQRSLIALYTILHCCVQPDGVLLLDEPDNFVALNELQPWLVSLADKVAKERGQAILISHHPECIDYLAGSGIQIVKRTAGGATTIAPLSFDGSTELKPSEAIARGWIDA